MIIWVLRVITQLKMKQKITNGCKNDKENTAQAHTLTRTITPLE